MLLGRILSLEQNQFIVVGKSNMPFNVDSKMLRRVAVPDAGKIPSKREEMMQTSRGLTKEQCLGTYHKDNGRFGEKAFRATCDEQGQDITFCGMRAHHQNGIAENWIKLLALKSWIMLLHAKRHWPEYITTMLWPYALKMAETLTEHHTWGCPVYILDASLWDRSGSVPKWDPWAKLGIYLGPSSVHAGNVHLFHTLGQAQYQRCKKN
eukprot:1723792-Ditylum_brightwellii.AAC.1